MRSVAPPVTLSTPPLSSLKLKQQRKNALVHWNWALATACCCALVASFAYLHSTVVELLARHHQPDTVTATSTTPATKKLLKNQTQTAASRTHLLPAHWMVCSSSWCLVLTQLIVSSAVFLMWCAALLAMRRTRCHVPLRRFYEQLAQWLQQKERVCVCWWQHCSWQIVGLLGFSTTHQLQQEEAKLREMDELDLLIVSSLVPVFVKKKRMSVHRQTRGRERESSCVSSVSSDSASQRQSQEDQSQPLSYQQAEAAMERAEAEDELRRVRSDASLPRPPSSLSSAESEAAIEGADGCLKYQTEARILLSPQHYAKGGRHQSNRIILEDPFVSRFHFVLAYDLLEKSYFLQDVGSRTGTFVFLRPNEPKRLREKDQIRLGESEFQVVLMDEHPLQGSASAHLQILFTEGPLKGTLQTIRRNSCVTLGRSSSNAICIVEDPMVSARHCVISYDTNGFYVTDLSSTNGTAFRLSPSGHKSRRHWLVHGDIFGVGSNRFLVEYSYQIETALEDDDDDNDNDNNDDDSTDRADRVDRVIQ